MIIRETDYAIRCVLHLAGKKDEVLMLNEISRKNNIPKSFLAKILQKLTKAEIVKSYRGVKGGYQIAREPADLDLLDIVETIQGPLVLNKCIVDRKACSRKNFCTVHPLWNIMVECMIDKMKKCSVDKLLDNKEAERE